MKAKLVTQPSGKPVGAKVIGGATASTSTSASTPEPSTSSSTPSKSSPRGRFARMPAASPVSPRVKVDSDEDTSSSRSRIGSPEPKKPLASPSQDPPDCCLGPVETADRFPKLGSHAHLVEAPVYAPTEREFKDPIAFIERIRAEAEPFGFCRVIPPPSFKVSSSVHHF